MTYVKASPQKGVLHEYQPQLTAFEFGFTNAKNALVFIGGLGDGLLTVPYVPRLAEAIHVHTNEEWTVVQALISASYQGWGTSSLARDTKELSRLVKYLKEECKFSKIVLMGHLTGCQDALYYITHEDINSDLSNIDGAILQAPVSDSEGFASGFTSKDQFEEMLNIVKNDFIDAGKLKHILPQNFREKFWNCPITAYRYYSLASERGDDDFFSSYLNEDDLAETFGKVATKLLVLYGEKDEFVPEFVDKKKIFNSWKLATKKQYWSSESKILLGATHNVGPKSDEGAERDLIDTVIKFIGSI